MAQGPTKAEDTDQNRQHGSGTAAQSADESIPYAIDSTNDFETIEFDNYRIERLLGQGGMGRVYLARNLSLERLEVVKVVQGDLLERPEIIERFRNEVRNAAKLDHPNVVTVYAFLQNKGRIACAMQFIDGQDLQKLVNDRGPLATSLASHYVRQAALGLQHAHQRGMIHRDIKPQNLMVTREGNRHTVKVVDFGLSKVRSDSSANGLTGTGYMMGTPDFVSPEQIQDASRVDIRGDIYSLGCTFYYLLTGERPFRGSSLFEVLEAHVNKKPAAIQQLRPNVAAELVAIVDRMMAKSPADRFQSPIDVANALQPFLRSTGKPEPNATVSGPPRSADTQSPPPLPEKLSPLPVPPEIPKTLLRQTKAKPPRKPRVARDDENAEPRPKRRKLKWVLIALGLVALVPVSIAIAAIVGGPTTKPTSYRSTYTPTYLPITDTGPTVSPSPPAVSPAAESRSIEMVGQWKYSADGEKKSFYGVYRFEVYGKVTEHDVPGEVLKKEGTWTSSGNTVSIRWSSGATETATFVKRDPDRRYVIVSDSTNRKPVGMTLNLEPFEFPQTTIGVITIENKLSVELTFSLRFVSVSSQNVHAYNNWTQYRIGAGQVVCYSTPGGYHGQIIFDRSFDDGLQEQRYELPVKIIPTKAQPAATDGRQYEFQADGPRGIELKTKATN